MTTIYLISDKTAAKKDHGRILLESADGKRQGIPLGDVESVVLGRHVIISAPSRKSSTKIFGRGRGAPAARPMTR